MFMHVDVFKFATHVYIYVCMYPCSHASFTQYVDLRNAFTYIYTHIDAHIHRILAKATTGRYRSSVHLYTYMHAYIHILHEIW